MHSLFPSRRQLNDNFYDQAENLAKTLAKWRGRSSYDANLAGLPGHFFLSDRE
jgi:hypothetical protein